MPNPFVVLFTARSGSTALFGNLKQHPDIDMRAEVFGGKTLPGGLAQTDANRVAFLRQFWAGIEATGAARTGQIAKGFKLQITRTNAQFTDPARFVNFSSSYAPKVIVLRRANHVKQVISALNARRVLRETAVIRDGRATAHITPDLVDTIAQVKSQPLQIDLPELARMLNGLKRNYQALDRIAVMFPDRIDITYEDYLQDRDGLVADVMDFIGVDPSRALVQDAYLKITSDDISDVVENYDELSTFAKGTEYAAMLN